MITKTVADTISAALVDSGVKIVTCVPGAGGNEVFTGYNKLIQLQNPVSFHEETAYSLAHGASLVGTRSAVLVKSHGIIKAGNSVTDSLFSGSHAGMLALVFTDKTGQHSDSILDIEPFLKGIGIPYQIADMENIYQQVCRLMDLSEKMCLPQALVVESSDIQRVVSTESVQKWLGSGKVYQRDIVQRVLCPFFNQYQSAVLNCKNHNADWSLVPRPAIPRMPDCLTGSWKAQIENYAGLFSIFSRVRGPLVTGDTGISSLFAFEPYNCVDITTYLGGSVPLAVGAYLGGCREVWAMTGDFAFIAAGHLGLLEAKQRQIPLKVLILYNGRSATTGGQVIPENSLETVLSGYQESLSYIHDPRNRDETETILRKAQQSEKMSIVIADYRKLS